MRKWMVTFLVAPAMGLAAPAAAVPVENFTVVTHDSVKSFHFDSDICGPRANTTTFEVKTEQVHFTAHPDGTFTYHDVGVATYTSDFDDPTIEDISGRLTEVNRFTFTKGGVFTGTTTYHDFVGDIRIFTRIHVTVVDDVVVVERMLVDKVTGCP